MTDQTPKHMQAEDEHHFGKNPASQTEKEGTSKPLHPPPLVSAGSSCLHLSPGRAALLCRGPGTRSTCSGVPLRTSLHTRQPSPALRTTVLVPFSCGGGGGGGGGEGEGEEGRKM